MFETTYSTFPFRVQPQVDPRAVIPLQYETQIGDFDKQKKASFSHEYPEKLTTKIAINTEINWWQG